MSQQTLGSLQPAFQDIPRLYPRGLPEAQHIRALWLSADEEALYDFHPLLRGIGGTAVAPDTYEWVLGMFDKSTGALGRLWFKDDEGTIRGAEPAGLRIARPGALMHAPA